MTAVRLAAVWGTLAVAGLARANAPVFYEGAAGPYELEVRIDPPEVVPGMARIAIRSADPDLTRVRLLALPIDREEQAYPPVPDTAETVEGSGAAFVGRLWLMASGSWEVRLLVDGARGPAEIAVPVAALPTHVASMSLSLGLLLFGLLVILTLGMVSIAAAAVREGQLGAGRQAGSTERRSGRVAAAVTVGVMVGVVVLGGRWWSASERAYARSIYRPLTLSAELQPDGRELKLALGDPGWLPSRKLGDLVASGGHLMDLWVLEAPSFEHVWHLHPTPADGGFVQALPQMTGGHYALFASVVHEDGLQETARTEVTLPAIAGEPLGPDDAAGQGGPLATAEAGVAALPNGGRVRLETNGPSAVGQPLRLRFHVEDRAEGRPALDLEPLEGRRAEGALVSADLSVFEYLSSRGTVAPAAWAVANPDAGEGVEPQSSDFAFEGEAPRAGRYRLFVELRRGGRNEIALFDLRAF